MFKALFAKAERKREAAELLRQAKKRPREEEEEEDEDEDEEEETKKKKTKEDALRAEVATFWKKALAKGPTTDSDDDDNDDDEENEGVPGATRSADARKVFVGGLHGKPTTASVSARFSAHGEVRKVLLVRSSRNPRKPATAAFVEFATRAAAKAAIAAENGKNGLRVAAVRSKSGGGGSGSGSGGDASSRVLFVRNVAFDATEQLLRQAFAGCGDIVAVRMPRHADTRRPKGTAFVQFATRAGLDAGLAKDRTVVAGRAVLCSVSERKTLL